MFDLPFNPDLLEQRIGRLDRIGKIATLILAFLILKGLLNPYYYAGIMKA